MFRTGDLSRRQFFHATGAAVGSLALVPAPGSVGLTRAATGPRRLSAGPHLFLDDDLVNEAHRMRRFVMPPERHGESIVSAAEDKCFQPYVSVLRDPATGRFRLWYNTAIDANRSHIGYLESDDGIHFLRPHRELADPSGLPVAFGAYVVDDGTDFPDPRKRYKLAWEYGGLFTATSPDGLHWTATRPERVMDGIGDIIALSRDPIRSRYLLTCKLPSRPGDGYKGSTPNAAEGTRRLVGQSFSHDLVAWSEPERIIVPDERDQGVTEFYGIGNVIARGELLIGLLKVLRDDLAPEPGGAETGIGYTCLAWTRDGTTWQRDREPFMDRNPTPGTWDRAMTWGDCLLPVGDEIFVYYGGYARGHKVERFKERQIGIARMPRDRFVARVAGDTLGTMRTTPFLFDADRLSVNAAIAGELRIAVLDGAGAPLEGFDTQDCAPIQGDSLAHAPRWSGPVAELRGRVVQFLFSARHANLFSFAAA